MTSLESIKIYSRPESVPISNCTPLYPIGCGPFRPLSKSNIAIGYVNKDFMKIGSTVYAEIYHPEELEYKKIWANCKVVKKQFFNPQRRYSTPADI